MIAVVGAMPKVQTKHSNFVTPSSLHHRNLCTEIKNPALKRIQAAISMVGATSPYTTKQIGIGDLTRFFATTKEDSAELTSVWLQLFKQNAPLRTTYLQHAYLTQPSFDSFCEAIKESRTFENLTLNYTTVDFLSPYEMFQKLLASLKQHPTVKELTMIDQQLKDDSAVLLAASLKNKQLTQLQHIYLSRNSFSFKGTLHIMDACLFQKNLKTLSIPAVGKNSKDGVTLQDRYLEFKEKGIHLNFLYN